MAKVNRRKQFQLPFWLLLVSGASFATQIGAVAAGVAVSVPILVLGSVLLVAALITDGQQ